MPSPAGVERVAALELAERALQLFLPLPEVDVVTVAVTTSLCSGGTTTSTPSLSMVREVDHVLLGRRAPTGRVGRFGAGDSRSTNS